MVFDANKLFCSIYQNDCLLFENVCDLLEHSLSVYTQVKNLDELKKHLTNIE